MPFFYTATREKVNLESSPDNIAVLFETSGAAAESFRPAAGVREAPPTPETPSRFGRVVLLPRLAAAREAFPAMRDAFRASSIRLVRRTIPVYVDTSSGLRLVASRQISVRFKPRTSARRREALLAGLKLTSCRANAFKPQQFVLLPSENVDENGALELANKLAEEDDIVAFASPNFIAEHRKEATTNDPQLRRQWHLHNTGAGGGVAGEDVDAFLAWDITPGGGPDTVIAIVDDGVDIGHPDLRAGIWVNPNKNAPDRNGRNFYDDNYDPRPHYWRRPYHQLTGNDSHGTPCAGVAAAVGNNRRGVAGIAYNCRILPVKIFGADNLAPNDRVADAIRYAGLHAQVISCSWTTPSNPDLESAINDVVQGGRGGKGCLVFCATGNAGQSAIAFPARHPLTLATGASNDQGVRSAYSNHGEGIDFVAPSSDPARNRPGIVTTDVSKTNRGFTLHSAYTEHFGGTSSATPLAAGIAALVLSVNPNLGWSEVRDILRGSAEKIDEANGGYNNDGWSPQYGHGRVNAYEALVLAQKS